MVAGDSIIFSEKKMMRSPGFEPELEAWEASVLTRLDYDRMHIFCI